MSSRIKTLLSYLLTAALSAAATGIVSTCRHQKPPVPGGDNDVQVDSTVTQIDTTMAVMPDPSEIRHDTIYIKIPATVPAAPDSVPPASPTVPAEDSVIYLPVILEQKVYEDPDSTYRAVVSGPAIDKYGPKLDTISVYSRKETVYQTKTVYVEPSRWSIGLQAGYGASKDGLTPYIGIGIQYNLWNPKARRSPP